MVYCGLLLDPDALNNIDAEVWKAVLFTKMLPCAIQIQMHRCDTDTLCEEVYVFVGVVQNQHPLLCPASLVTHLYEYTNVEPNFYVFVSYSVFVFPVDLGCLCLHLNHYISVSFLSPTVSSSHSFSASSTLSPQCTAIIKHWPESQALRRLRGSGLTDRWISPQAPRTGIVQEAFPSHWDPCGLRIPGFCCNNKASHTAKRKYCSKALQCFNCRCCAFPHFAPPFSFYLQQCASISDRRLESSENICNSYQSCYRDICAMKRLILTKQHKS